MRDHTTSMRKKTGGSLGLTGFREEISYCRSSRRGSLIREEVELLTHESGGGKEEKSLDFEREGLLTVGQERRKGRRRERLEEEKEVHHHRSIL